MPKFVPAPREELIARGVIAEDDAADDAPEVDKGDKEVETPAPKKAPAAKKAPARRAAAPQE